VRRVKRVTRTRPPGQWQFEAHTARGRGTAPRARQARTRNRKILTGSSLHLCSRVPHGPRKISRYVGMCSAIFAFCGVTTDVASHVASSGRACRVGRRVGRRVRWIDGSRSLSPFYFPARRAGGGRGRGARGGAAGPGVRRVVSLSRLQYNFVRVSVISLQSAPWAARQTTQESAPAGGACSSGTSRCARRSVCLVALRHISWATGSGRVPRARSLIYATPA
jgi:hypothetical protein